MFCHLLTLIRFRGFTRIFQGRVWKISWALLRIDWGPCWMNFWGVDPRLFVLWFLFSHPKCLFRTIGLKVHLAALSVFGTGISVFFSALSCCWLISLVASRLHWCFVEKTFVGWAQTSLYLQRILHSPILCYVFASGCQGPKIFHLNSGQMQRHSRWSLILSLHNQSFSQLQVLIFCL